MPDLRQVLFFVLDLSPQQAGKGHLVLAKTHLVVAVKVFNRNGVEQFDQAMLRTAHPFNQRVKIIQPVFRDQFGVEGVPVPFGILVKGGQLARADGLNGLAVGVIPAGQVGQQVKQRPGAKEYLGTQGRRHRYGGFQDFCAGIDHIRDQRIFLELSQSTHG